MFVTASLLVMPYTSASGPSGVAHQACQFGLPIVSADIPEFRDMAEEEGIAIEFYRTGDAPSLARALIALLRDPQRQREMAEINFSAAVRMTMPEIIRQYLRSFERERRIHQLRPRRSVIAGRWSSAA
jgi:glycosyltransferase involved in cell wall biosynthesis